MRPTVEQVLSEPAGRRLDAWVAEYVCGIKVLGEACVTCYDGSWDVDLRLDTADPNAWVRPVFKERDPLPDYDYPEEFGRLAGIPAGCLGVVEEYSSSWAAAGPLLGRLRQLLGGACLIEADPLGRYHVRTVLEAGFRGRDGANTYVARHLASGDSGPHAIARAAVIHALEGRDGR